MPPPKEPTKRIGTEREVWNGTARQTSGGNTIERLGQRRDTGKIVSLARFRQGLKNVKYIAHSKYFGRPPRAGGSRRAGGSTAAPEHIHEPRAAGYMTPQQQAFLQQQQQQQQQAFAAQQAYAAQQQQQAYAAQQQQAYAAQQQQALAAHQQQMRAAGMTDFSLNDPRTQLPFQTDYFF